MNVVMNHSDISRVWPEFNKAVSLIREEYHIPDLAVAVVAQESKVFTECLGDINARSIFQIASISKTFTSYVLAKLVSLGLIAWEDRLDGVVPNITIKDIISMQSGLAAFAGREAIPKAQHSCDIIASLAEAEVVSKPGSGCFSYQYALFAVIEQIVSVRMKMTWGQVLSRFLLQNLGLEDTGIETPPLSNAVKAYSEQGESLEWESFKVPSAAGMYSSLDNMVTWLKFNLSDSLASKLHIPIVAIENNYGLLSPLPEMQELSYGLGWKSFKIGQELVIEHNGNSTGMSAILTLLPTRQIGIVVLANKLSPVPELIRKKFLEVVIN